MFMQDDKVFDIVRGWGVVAYTSDPLACTVYPIRVRFSGIRRNEVVSYTSDGKEYDEREIATLYHAVPNIEAPPEPERLPYLEMDAPILVRDDPGKVWSKRHFRKWVVGNEPWTAWTWVNGQTSWTTGDSVPWSEWKLPEEAPDDC